MLTAAIRARFEDEHRTEPIDRDAAFHAQFDEDRILAERFFPGVRSGTCVEVGAGDGLRFSNTAYFERLGWRCLLVEANPDAVSACRRNRSSMVVHAAAVGKSSLGPVSFTVATDCPDLSSLRLDEHNRGALKRYFGGVASRDVIVPSATLDDLFDDWLPDAPIDFVTIDVEGHELEVLTGLDLARWQPRVVIVERNARRPSWQILGRFARAGYRLGMTTGVNDWYMRPDDLPRRGMRWLLWLALTSLVGRSG